MKRIFKNFLFAILLIPIVVISACLYFWCSSSLNETRSHETVAPKSGHFVEVGDNHVFVQELGPMEGPAIVFIHGTGSWSELWKASMKTAAAMGFRAVALDMQPFGFSYRSPAAESHYERLAQGKLICEVLSKLGIDRRILVGHSFGGRATITAALLEPDKVNKLILVDVALGFGELETPTAPAEAPALLDFILANDTLRHLIGTIGSHPLMTRTLVEKFVSHPKSVTHRIVLMYQTPTNTIGKAEELGLWLKSFLLSSDHELIQKTEIYAALKAPVHIVWGSADSVTPLWQAERIKSFFANATIHELSNVGHIPMIEDRKGFRAILTAALTKQPKSEQK